MSTSQFDPTQKLGTDATPSPGSKVMPSTQPFVATGPLETDATSVKQRQVWVFVIIEQTPQNAGLDATTVAKGFVLKEGPSSWMGKWWADMTVQSGPGFVPGPATGTAITVEYSYDPIGFDTFTWTDRIALTP